MATAARIVFRTLKHEKATVRSERSVVVLEEEVTAGYRLLEFLRVFSLHTSGLQFWNEMSD
jgi:hypothetical protein